MDECVTAALLGAAFEYQQETGKKVFINQLNGPKGGHSGHGSMGDRVDLQYVRTDGKEGRNETTWKTFDKNLNQALLNKLLSFGFTRAFTQASKGSNTPALDQSVAVDPHHHHLHVDAGNKAMQTSNFNEEEITAQKPASPQPGDKRPEWRQGHRQTISEFLGTSVPGVK